jgi:hypothetical protein
LWYIPITVCSKTLTNRNTSVSGRHVGWNSCLNMNSRSFTYPAKTTHVLMPYPKQISHISLNLPSHLFYPYLQIRTNTHHPFPTVEKCPPVHRQRLHKLRYPSFWLVTADVDRGRNLHPLLPLSNPQERHVSQRRSELTAPIHKPPRVIPPLPRHTKFMNGARQRPPQIKPQGLAPQRLTHNSPFF